MSTIFVIKGTTPDAKPPVLWTCYILQACRTGVVSNAALAELPQEQDDKRGFAIFFSLSTPGIGLPVEAVERLMAVVEHAPLDVVKWAKEYTMVCMDDWPIIRKNYAIIETIGEKLVAEDVTFSQLDTCQDDEDSKSFVSESSLPTMSDEDQHDDPTRISPVSITSSVSSASLAPIRLSPSPPPKQDQHLQQMQQMQQMQQQMMLRLDAVESQLLALRQQVSTIQEQRNTPRGFFSDPLPPGWFHSVSWAN
jgi:hypothetical protein